MPATFLTTHQHEWEDKPERQNINTTTTPGSIRLTTTTGTGSTAYSSQGEFESGVNVRNIDTATVVGSLQITPSSGDATWNTTVIDTAQNDSDWTSLAFTKQFTPTSGDVGWAIRTSNTSFGASDVSPSFTALGSGTTPISLTQTGRFGQARSILWFAPPTGANVWTTQANFDFAGVKTNTDTSTVPGTIVLSRTTGGGQPAGTYQETDANNRLSYADPTLTWTGVPATEGGTRGSISLTTSLSGAYTIDIDWTYTSSTLDSSAQQFFGAADSDTEWGGVQAFQGCLIGTGGDPAGDRVLQGYDNPRFGGGLDLAIGTTYYIRLRRNASNTFFVDIFATSVARNASTGGDGTLLATSEVGAQSTTWNRIYLFNNRNLGTGSSSGTSSFGTSTSFNTSGTWASDVKDTGGRNMPWYELRFSETGSSNSASGVGWAIRTSDTIFSSGASSPSYVSLGSGSTPIGLSQLGRFGQIRATLWTNTDASTPTVQDATIFFASGGYVSPRVDDVTISYASGGTVFSSGSIISRPINAQILNAEWDWLSTTFTRASGTTIVSVRTGNTVVPSSPEPPSGISTNWSVLGTITPATLSSGITNLNIENIPASGQFIQYKLDMRADTDTPIVDAISISYSSGVTQPVLGEQGAGWNTIYTETL